MKISTKSIYLGLLLNACYFFTSPMWAAQSVGLTIKGKLTIDDPCQISGQNGSPISVNFGDMPISDITGNNFGQSIPYKISCSPGSDTLIILTFVGATMSGQPDALATDNKDLGIRFQYSLSGTRNFARLNTDFVAFNSKGELPVITAYPRVYNANVSAVKTGAFSASITLRADYP
ncbi:fimbrial protein [Providencia sp. Me31A]